MPALLRTAGLHLAVIRRRWAPMRLATIVFLGVWVACSFVAWHRLRRAMAFDVGITSADTASEFLLGSYAVSWTDPILHGHYSMIGLPHPGPVYLHLVWLSRQVAGAVSLHPFLSMVFAYYVAVIGLACWAAMLVARTTQRWWCGVAVLVAGYALSTPMFTVSPGAMAAPVYILAVAAVCAVAARTRGGAFALAFVASVMAQLSLTTALVGVPLLGAAAWALLRRHDADRRTTRALGWLMIGSTALLGVVRIATEGGPAVLREYARRGDATKTQIDALVGDSLAATLDAMYPTILPPLWATLAFVVFLGAVAIVQRRYVLAGVAVVAPGLLFVFARWLFVADNGYQQTLFSALPTVIVTIACTVLCGWSGRAWRIAGSAVLITTLTFAGARADVPLVVVEPHGYLPAGWGMCQPACVPNVYRTSYNSVRPLVRDGQRHVVAFDIGVSDGGPPQLGAEAWVLLAWLEANGDEYCVYRLEREAVVYALPAAIACPDDVSNDPVLVVSVTDDPRYRNPAATVELESFISGPDVVPFTISRYEPGPGAASVLEAVQVPPR